MTVYGLQVSAINKDEGPCVSLMTGAIDTGTYHNNPHKCGILASLLPTGLWSDPALVGKLAGSVIFQPALGGQGYPVEGMASAAKLEDVGQMVLDNDGKAATELTSSNLIEDYWLNGKLSLTGSVRGTTIGSGAIHQVGGDPSLSTMSMDPLFLALLVGQDPPAVSAATFTLYQECTTTPIMGHKIRFKMAVVDETGQAVADNDPRWPDFGSVGDTPWRRVSLA